jgi:uncharacterized iron-regulated protein
MAEKKMTPALLRGLLPFCIFLLAAFSSGNLPAYRLYDGQGDEVRFQKMIKTLAEADVVLFGEYHDNPIVHWLQLETAKALYELKKDKLAIGMEMFESDNQFLINEYFLGLLSEKNFEKDCRLWPNYRTDYKPLLEMAREKGLKFVASNVPRRYASLVSQQGLAALNELPEISLSFLPPLPITVDLTQQGYQEMLQMGNGNELFPQAQALKDATMAYFILQNFEPGDCFLHLNGAFHSDRREGIAWYLKQANPNLKIAVVTTAQQAEIDKLEPEFRDRADFVICVPESMTRTH